MNMNRFILLCSLYVATVTSTTLGMLNDLYTSENKFTSETHEIYGYEYFVLTSDNKYYITKDYGCFSVELLLWNAFTKEKKRTFENRDSFVYLHKQNIILLFQKNDHTNWENERRIIGIYDVKAESMTQLEFDADVNDVKIDACEKWCAIITKSGIYITDIKDIGDISKYQFIKGNQFYFNIDANLFITTYLMQYNWYVDVFALQNDNTWKCIIKEHRLPFYPEKVHFMTDNYCIFYENENYCYDSNFLHMKFDKVDTDGEHFVQVIDNSAGIGYIPCETSKNCFASWVHNCKKVRFVAHDGTLMKEIGNSGLLQLRLLFISDEKYYVVTSRIRQSGCIAHKLLSLSLVSKQDSNAKKIKVIKRPLGGGNDITFSPNGKLFIKHGYDNCKLYNNNMKRLGSFPSVKSDKIVYTFGPDGHSIIDRKNKIRYELLPKKVMDSSVLLLCFLDQMNTK